MPKSFPMNREGLRSIRANAESYRDTEGLSASWQRALQELADAADKLDAMLARIESDYMAGDMDSSSYIAITMLTGKCQAQKNDISIS